MSYSFSVRAADQQEAKTKIAVELAKVVQAQPVHAADRQCAQQAAESFVNLLHVDDAQDISVSVTGSCWAVEKGLRQASVSVSATLVPKEQE